MFPATNRNTIYGGRIVYPHKFARFVSPTAQS